MAGLYFKETQKIILGWKWILFISLYALLFWALVDQLNVIEIDISAVSSIVFSLCSIFLFNVIIIIMYLETEIDKFKISFRYKPFHVKPRVIYWSDVSEFYVREFNPLREYGGHGLQRRVRKGRAYTVSGNVGLQLILNNGKKILIGSQKPKELELIVEKLKKQN